jgi:outer membrane protein assembly factor BamB
MARAQKLLYVGTNAIVAALDPATGEELWRTKLPKAGMGGSPVTILIKEQRLYVGCYGRAYCLDARTGDVLWQNGLPKMGYHTVLLALEGAQGVSSQDLVVAEARRQQEAAAAAAAGAGAAS